jgi:hypothetical protein
MVELLVVIAIITILAALLLPALAAAKNQSKRIACISNLRQLGVAIHTYSIDNGGLIPYGPKAPPFISPEDFYSSTGAPTSLISLATGGSPVGFGLMLSGSLASQPRVLFCPGSDQPINEGAQLALVGVNQAQCSYYYRHGGNTNLFDSIGSFAPDHLRLDNLGLNSRGQPIRALAIDTEFLCPPSLALFDVTPSTHHQQKFADIMFSDGHAASRPNVTNQFTVNLPLGGAQQAFALIMDVLETADAQP